MSGRYNPHKRISGGLNWMPQ